MGNITERVKMKKSKALDSSEAEKLREALDLIESIPPCLRKKKNEYWSSKHLFGTIGSILGEDEKDWSRHAINLRYL